MLWTQRERDEISCCHRDDAAENRVLILWPHSFASLVNFAGPYGIQCLLKSQPLCLYLSNILGQLLSELGIQIMSTYEAWRNMSMMDLVRSKYSWCLFCSKDFNESLWRNINEVNIPLCMHCNVHRIMGSSLELLILEAFILECVKWFSPLDLLGDEFLMCPIIHKYVSIIILLNNFYDCSKTIQQVFSPQHFNWEKG